MLSSKKILVVIGLGELLTGVLLMVRPDLMLSLLQIPIEKPYIYLRFVGAFVFGVGTLYFIPCIDKDVRTIKNTLLSTSILRYNIFLFLCVMIFLGDFHKSWLVVALYDGIVASIQTWFFMKQTI